MPSSCVLGESVYAAMPVLNRGKKFDWLYNAWCRDGLFPRIAAFLGVDNVGMVDSCRCNDPARRTCRSSTHTTSGCAAPSDRVIARGGRRSFAAVAGARTAAAWAAGDRRSRRAGRSFRLRRACRDHAPASQLLAVVSSGQTPVPAMPARSPDGKVSLPYRDWRRIRATCGALPPRVRVTGRPAATFRFPPRRGRGRIVLRRPAPVPSDRRVSPARSRGRQSG